MNFEIQTSSYFDAEAKRLAKRHRSFIDDLQDFWDSILKNPYQGTELSPGTVVMGTWVIAVIIPKYLSQWLNHELWYNLYNVITPIEQMQNYTKTIQNSYQPIW